MILQRSTTVLLMATLMLSGGCSRQPEKTYDVTIECRSPNGKRTTKGLKRWKYDTVREAILKVLPDEETGMAFPELKKKVTAEFTATTRRSAVLQTAPDSQTRQKAALRRTNARRHFSPVFTFYPHH